MKWSVPLSDIQISDQEKKAVIEVLDRGWISMGETTFDFERAFAELIHAKHAIAVSNGTTALHLACLAVGIREGDEVIVPSLTFVATANAVKYVGAVPVFADIQGDHDLTISPESIQNQITTKTKAILVMHYGGFSCQMQEIKRIAIEHGLSLIEDAAHAPGAYLNGKALGTWGDVGCFSFFANKNITTAEGGMITTNDDQLAEKIRLLRSHGMTTLTWDRHSGHAWSYDVLALGYNYRIDEIRSALGLVQLKNLVNNNQIREKWTNLYREQLQKEAPYLQLPFTNHPGISSYHIFPILIPKDVSKPDFIHFLKTEGIQTSMHYPPVHSFSFYRSTHPTNDLTILQKTESVANREVTLPLYPQMGEEKIDLVCNTIGNFFNNH